jgi:hypothetical protein
LGIAGKETVTSLEDGMPGAKFRVEVFGKKLSAESGISE